MIKGTENGDGARDIPVLFDQARIGVEVTRDQFNEVTVRHVQTLAGNRRNRSCGGHARERRPHARLGPVSPAVAVCLLKARRDGLNPEAMQGFGQGLLVRER